MLSIVNLGCGKHPKKGMLNVDIMPYEWVDKIVDLSVYPWPFKDGEFDGISCFHVLEHFQDQRKFLSECHRILKTGGFIHLKVPSILCLTSLGDISHYRGYTRSTLKYALSTPNYMFPNKMFETLETRLVWFDAKQWIKDYPLVYPLIPINLIMSKLINLIPRLYERYLWIFLGGCQEVVYKGEKI